MAIGTERRLARAGTGSCTRCTCSRFEGRGSVCENCRHHYDEHNIAAARETADISAWATAAPGQLTAEAGGHAPSC